jgi:hypothetical protein
MEYAENDHTAARKGAIFAQALARKLNHAPAQDKPEEVISVLKPELQEKIKKEKLRIFEGLYGWCIAPKYGQSGQVTMLTKEDLQ